MPNISSETLGTGHYPEDVFEEQIYEQGIQQDWWIEESKYIKLIQDLQNVTFEVATSRFSVANTINVVAKDLPAHPGVRFPSGGGVLGTESYSPLRYVRVPQSLKESFVDLISIANHVLITSDHYGFDAAHKYGRTLGILSTTVVQTYSRAKFERDFNLNWIPNPDGNAPVPLSRLR